MRIIPLFIALVQCFCFSISAQITDSMLLEEVKISPQDINTIHQPPEKKVYQPSKKKIIDIKHMRLEVKPFIEKKNMYGKSFSKHYTL